MILYILALKHFIVIFYLGLFLNRGERLSNMDNFFRKKNRNKNIFFYLRFFDSSITSNMTFLLINTFLLQYMCSNTN